MGPALSRIIEVSGKIKERLRVTDALPSSVSSSTTLIHVINPAEPKEPNLRPFCLIRDVWTTSLQFLMFDTGRPRGAHQNEIILFALENLSAVKSRAFRAKTGTKRAGQQGLIGEIPLFLIAAQGVVEEMCLKGISFSRGDWTSLSARAKQFMDRRSVLQVQRAEQIQKQLLDGALEVSQKPL